MELRVNGEIATLGCDEEDTLLHVLRNRLGLRGSRFGCGQESCGACMVLIDGVAAPSCTARASGLAGRDIVTVEGLPSLPALQRAFLEEQAGQCGYCLSGVIVSAAALLQSNPAPGRADIVAALDRNLCRCGAHDRIVRAVLRAAQAMGRATA